MCGTARSDAEEERLAERRVTREAQFKQGDRKTYVSPDGSVGSKLAQVDDKARSAHPATPVRTNDKCAVCCYAPASTMATTRSLWVA